MLAVLLVNANRPVTTVAIIDAVWRDDPPENGANVVQKYVAGLRRVLEPDRAPRRPGEVLALTDGGYVLTVDHENIDIELFNGYLRRASERPDHASELLSRAFALWRGTPLPGLSGPLFDSARERLLDARSAAVQAWAELEIGRGNHSPVVARLRDLIVEFPLREELRYLLILALERSGRRAEALAAYRDARQLLIDELGVEPGERLRELHLSILRADDASTPPAPFPAAAPRAAPVAARGRPWLRRLLAITIPLASFGLAAWTVIAYYAVRRRSRALGLAAAGYLVLVGVPFVFLGRTEPQPETLVGASTLILAIAVFGAATHGLLLSGDPVDRRSGPPAEIAARVRREQARQLARDHPSIAAALRVGRPDLPRTFDDGGLVDLNAVPEAFLAALPGIGPETARRIVADRWTRGPLTTVEDLVHRELVPGDVLHSLLETAVVLPVPAPQVPTANPVPLALPRQAAHNGFSARA